MTHNKWIKKSIDLANEFGYLDNLGNIYPQNYNELREINLTDWERVVSAFESKNNLELVKNLLKMEKFPTSNSYASFLRKQPNSLQNNPKTVEDIAQYIHKIGIELTEQKCRDPKESSRQRGSDFRSWLHSNFKTVSKEDFLNTTSEIVVLKGGDKFLKEFAIKHLGLSDNKLSKGLDLVGRNGSSFFVGEAKFITDNGGSQDNQFEVMTQLCNCESKPDVIKIGILDGVSWIPSDTKNYKYLKETNNTILSALLLKEFLETFNLDSTLCPSNN